MDDLTMTQHEPPSSKRLAVSLQDAKEPGRNLVAFQTYAMDRRAERGDLFKATNLTARLTERGRTLGAASLERAKARRAARFT
jgi:hypothetical protein